MGINQTSDCIAQLEILQKAFLAANPKSGDIFEATRMVMPGGNTRSNLYYSPFPLCFTFGEGATLRDADGHSYRDFLCEYTAGVFGHSHPAILRALAEVSSRGLSLGGPNIWERAFAEELVRRFPAIERIRFTNSGTEANLLAISAARAFTRKEKTIVFEGAYHGSTLTFVSPGHPLNVPFPFLIARYNDTDSVRRLIQAHTGEIAAVFVEPMLSSGGCIPGRDDFLRNLRLITEAEGILLVFDEVVTSRLGAHGVHGALGLRPDLVTLGKYIGGGLGCGAFGGRGDIMEIFDPGRQGSIAHAGTFNNNTLTMGVGLTAVKEVFTGEVADELCERGERLRKRLNDLAIDRGLPIQLTGRGSSMNIHFVRGLIERPNDDTRGHAAEKAMLFFHLVSRGIYLAPRGMINVSIVHTDRDFDAVVEAVDEFATLYGNLLSSGNVGDVL